METIQEQVDEFLQATEDARLHRNSYGPYDSAKEAIKAMLED